MVVNEKTITGEDLLCFTFFQAVATKIHLLQDKTSELLNIICRKFVKPEKLSDIGQDFEFEETESHKCISDISLGFDSTKEICKRLPIGDPFLNKLKGFMPGLALLHPDRAQTSNYIVFVARTFRGFDEDLVKSEWYRLHLDFTIEEKNKLSKLSFDDMWKQICRHSYPSLRKLVNAVRSLSNSNADSERVFSYLPDLKTKNGITCHLPV
ncbi:hypothetical protein PV326_004193 [Microctonus aethiopoides]|nr:hypothetical protein PV326_004193 [Microctonus aethiopoides]